jgi:hypothetical protein
MHRVLVVRVSYIWVLCHLINTNALSFRGLGYRGGRGMKGWQAEAEVCKPINRHDKSDSGMHRVFVVRVSYISVLCRLVDTNALSIPVQGCRQAGGGRGGLHSAEGRRGLKGRQAWWKCAG